MAFTPRTEPIENYFDIYDEIGRGQYAVVKRCREKASQKEYAAKFVRKRRKGKDCRAEVWHEVEILSATNYPNQHPQIITLYDVFETRSEIILILELALGGDLHRHCIAYDSDEPASSRSEREVVFLLRQILEGVKHMHEQDYVHLDIKHHRHSRRFSFDWELYCALRGLQTPAIFFLPNNILLMTEHAYPEIKIIDFGLARQIKDGEQICLIVGTPEYVAPEILEFEPVGKPSDIWSIGVVAYVMLTGLSPFAGDDKQETCYNVSLAAVEFPEEYFKNISHTAQDFIKRLLQRDADERLSVQECLNHPWLNTEELFQRSPIRKSRRSYSSDQNKKRKKLKKMQQQNGVTDDKSLAVVNGDGSR